MTQQPKPTTLAEVWEQYEVTGARITSADRRQFMGGALAALQLMKSGATHAQLLAECVQYGRSIGSAAERAGRRELITNPAR